MTDHQHAATGPGPGSGPRPSQGAGPRDAASASGAAGGTAAGETASAGAPHPPGEAPVPEPPHRFRRDRRHQMLGGVCSGLGRQCDMDPVIFRITLAVLSATGGVGLIFYGFAWLLVPYEGEEENEIRRLLTGRVDGHTLAAILFALVGCGVFLTMLNNGGVLSFAVMLSLLLAGAGYWSRQRGTPSPDPLAAQAVADAPPEPQAPPVPAAFSSWWRDPIVKDGTHIGGTGYLWGPRDSRDPDIASRIDVRLDPHSSARGDSPTRHRAAKPRGPRWIGGWIFLLALLAAGLGTGLTWQEQPLGTSLQTGLAGALAVFGLGLAVSAFLGRTGAGSILLAVITAGLLAASSAVPKDIGTEWMRTAWEPASVAQIRPAYDLGTGTGTLDLSGVRIPEGETVSTRANVGVGRIHVIVPEGVTVKLSVDVGVGDIQLPGDKQKDVDVAPGKHEEVTLRPAAGAEKTGTLELDIHVGAGQAEVSRATS
ncbi:PspC domain-containing protein [Streptomyces sp. NPDC085927]|uniref:PspC domain-containing protein n=1 Tax=Streptomyces sp. NPDC085927 TaxID=3365738 RepID=UPI0037D58A19